MSEKDEVVRVHPEGEGQSTGKRPLESVTSVDTFAGKIHVRWAPEASVSSMGLMVFFIEFLKTSDHALRDREAGHSQLPGDLESMLTRRRTQVYDEDLGRIARPRLSRLALRERKDHPVEPGWPSPHLPMTAVR